jgi:hypothetical protein
MQAVAQRYAMGYSWNRAAVLSGVSWATLTDWRARPDFHGYAEGLRQEVLESAEPQFAGLIEKAQGILLRVGDDLEPDDQLAEWAERILGKTLWPVLVARGMAASGITIDRGQSVRIATGTYDRALNPGGGER